MSEHDNEPDIDFTAPDERDEPDEEAPAEDDQRDQTSAQAAEADGSDALIKKAEKAQTNYAKRIRDIFGDGAPQYDCPTCSGLGLVWSIEEPQRQFVHPDNYVTCDACNGEGQIETGSKNPTYVLAVCTACSGQGYKIVTPQPENVTPITPSVSTAGVAAPTPVMGWMGPDGQFVPLGTPQAGNG